MRPIRYIGRYRNAGYGHTLTYRIRMELALYVNPRFAPASKKRKWEQDYCDEIADMRDEYDDTGLPRLEAEIAHFERLCAIERGR